MNFVPRNILSALLMVMFSIVSITGVMMYFKIRMLSSEALHIWLGFTFVVLSALHLFKNWNGFFSYFKKRSTLLSMIFGLGVILAFVLPPLLNPTSQKSINPKSVVFKAMMSAPLSNLTAFVNLDDELIVKALAEKQIRASHKQSITEIAKANDKTNDEVMAIVFSTSKVQ